MRFIGMLKKGSFFAVSIFVVAGILNGLSAFAQQSSSVQFKPYGYIKLDTSYDTARAAYGDILFWTQPDTAAGGDKQELNFSARGTRLGVNIIAPENRSIKVAGRIEGDLCEEISTPNKYAPRLRLAYIEAAWGEGWSLRFGQDWDTYVNIHPDMVDASILAFHGHPYGRHPQIRLTKETKLGEKTFLTTKLALQHGRNGSDLDADGQPDENASSSPNFHGSLVFKTGLLTDRPTLFSISAAYGREKALRAGNSETFRSLLIDGTLQLPISKHFTLQGEGWAGENVDNYFAGIGQGVNMNTGATISSIGGWVQGVYSFNKTVKVGAGYGIDDPDDNELSGNAKTLNDRIFTNVFYNLTDKLTFGLEYSWMHTDYAVTKNAQNHRVHFGVQYTF